MAVVESNTENIEHIDNTQVNEKTTSKTKEVAKKRLGLFVLTMVFSSSWPSLSSLLDGGHSLPRMMVLLKVNKWTLAGIIVSMSCPTTIASNIVMSRKSNANFSLTYLFHRVG
ncbi:unnamed protein product [Hanseniaspora opuntiae]